MLRELVMAVAVAVAVAAEHYLVEASAVEFDPTASV
jgi:hypothetical protein